MVILVGAGEKKPFIKYAGQTSFTDEGLNFKPVQRGAH